MLRQSFRKKAIVPLSISRLNDMAAELVVPYSEKNATAHAEFAARNWPDNPLRRDPNYIRWKFRAHKTGAVDGLLLAIREQQVIGQVGLAPVLLRASGIDYPGQWLSDFRVDPAYRIQGIGPMLVARAVSRNLATVADAPTAQSKPVLKALNFQELKGPRRMHLPLAPARVASRLLNSTILRRHPHLVPLAASLAPLYLAWRARRLIRPGSFPCVTKCRWEELLDRIREVQSRIAPLHVVHDTSFLSWRSSRFGEGLEGMHGLRTPTDSYLLFGKHRLCLYVFEWAASSEEETRALFSAARLIGKSLGADSLSVLANTSQEQEWLQALGFFTDRKPYELYFHSPPDFGLSIDRLHCCHCDAHANL